ncbi:hypothetical protein [Sphingosinicella xenopeptidilytica]|uniref:Phage tail tube protein n=1 Tax=Sphingosinicella xenopeptidilytica TaxID=364098 RepID=A0ABW3C116_SPHXN
MTIPASADLGVLSIRTAVGPPAVYAVLCGLTNLGINETISTSETFVRDCDTPNRPGGRKIRNQGYSCTITASGQDNIDLYETYADALGVRQVYQIDLREDDGSDTGASMGLLTVTGIMTARNRSISDESPGTLEVTFEAETVPVWVPVT